MVIAKAQDQKLMLPSSYTRAVLSACFSPDGRKILTSAKDNTVKLWDTETATLLADLKGTLGDGTSSCFSPDGKKILAASFTGHTANVWDAESGRLLFDLKVRNSLVSPASFSPDSKKIIMLALDGIPKIFEAQTGKLIVQLEGHTGRVTSAYFSPDGKKIVTASEDRTAKIWNAQDGALLMDLKGHTGGIRNACFSPDGKKIVTVGDSTIKIWDVRTGILLTNLKKYINNITNNCFSADSKRIVIPSRDDGFTAKIYDVESGAFLFNLNGHTSYTSNACFSPDGKKIVTTSGYQTLKIWDAKSGVLLIEIKGTLYMISGDCFSKNGKKIVTEDFNSVKIWDTESGNLLVDFNGHNSGVMSAYFSPEGKRIVTISRSNSKTAKIWDAQTGTFLANLIGHRRAVLSAVFSPDGKKIVTTSDDSTVKIWDVQSGALLLNLPGHASFFERAFFLPDGKVVTTYAGSSKLWDAQNGRLLHELKGHGELKRASFSPDGKKLILADANAAKIWDVDSWTALTTLITGYSGGTPEFSPDGKKILAAGNIWNAQSGKLLIDLKGWSRSIMQASFSPDATKIVGTSWDSTFEIWDVQSGALIADFKRFTRDEDIACFSPDSKKILTGCSQPQETGHTVSKIWDAQTGKLLDSLGDYSIINNFSFSGDSKKVITASVDNTAKIWDTDRGILLYTFLSVDSSDYLVLDKDNHYDGSQNARNLLYYTCGTEVIDLQQLKDKLWVPGLAERINNGETISSPKLSDLEICGWIPTVEQIENKTGYQFKIITGKGGLGETILHVNGIETLKYKPSDLKRVAGGYDLIIQKEDLKQFFVAGKENIVSVKAYTKENDISSRGVTVLEAATAKGATVPNLYAVVIGVSDYKGDELDLRYAAKDARDFSNAVSLSAGKLLGKEHVFMYDLTTAAAHSLIPEKKSIKDVFTQIANKASTSDILLIFFAGHGVVAGEKKQFYFLTADASPSSITSTGVKDVGISAAELMDWMKPATIKAQKRILILDACQGGSVINDFVDIGEKGQGYVAARNDDKAEEIKQIDKLNEKAGLYILAASASNQNAYEMGRYSQGLLTYALLKVIKEHPEVLEQNKFLNVSGWFNEAEKIVSRIVRESNLRQEPQLITTTNFNIGVVDQDVLLRIILPDEKPLFAASNFQNSDEAVGYDDMEIGKAVDRQLNEVSVRGSDEAISFISTTESPDAYFLVGRYEVKDDQVTLHVNIRQRKEKLPKYKFEIKGKKDDVKSFAENIVQKAIESIGKNK